MSVVASGPPFVSRNLCKCGWMWEDECKKTEGCGLKNGMPEYEQRATLHTPYEFLDGKDFGVAGDRRSEVDLNKVCREVVEDLVKEQSALAEFHAEVRRRHPSVDWHGPGRGVHEDDGEPITLDGIQDWVKNGPPGSVKWDNTAPVTYLGAREPSTHQIGGTHYAEMEVQPWDAMRAWMSPSEYAAYHIGTVIGYLARHKKKGGLTDIKKSHHHLSELIRYFEEEEDYPW